MSTSSGLFPTLKSVLLRTVLEQTSVDRQQCEETPLCGFKRRTVDPPDVER